MSADPGAGLPDGCGTFLRLCETSGVVGNFGSRIFLPPLPATTLPWPATRPGTRHVFIEPEGGHFSDFFWDVLSEFIPHVFNGLGGVWDFDV